MTRRYSYRVWQGQNGWRYEVRLGRDPVDLLPRVCGQSRDEAATHARLTINSHRRAQEVDQRRARARWVTDIP